MTLKEFASRRRKLQLYTWAGLPLVVVGGWFLPLLGYLLIGCMLGALGIAAYGKGRLWCDWMCPRGSFYDLFLDRISRKKKIPEMFRSSGSRIAVIVGRNDITAKPVHYMLGGRMCNATAIWCHRPQADQPADFFVGPERHGWCNAR